MMIKERILVSISGGRTSAMMAILIKRVYGHKYDIRYVFANTGREEIETLIFLDRVDKHFGLGVIWVEVDVQYSKGVGTKHKVVDFSSSSKNGDVFENVIKKYGIPNSAFLHCTRELKTAPIRDYLKSIGWGNYRKDYKTAIGYRADEPKRINWEKAKKENQWYPLVELGIKKEDVNLFWSQQPFDLDLKDYEGNCKLCYKKSKRKLLTSLIEKPENAEWVKEMESKYEMFTPEGRKNIKPPYRFFKENESIYDLIEESKFPFEKSVDKSKIINGAKSLMEFDIDMDYENECSESCEAF